MPQDPITQSARIPIVRMISGGRRWPESRKYEVVTHSLVDERDVEHLSAFVWTLAKDRKTDYANRSVWTGEKTVKVQMHGEIWVRHNGPIPEGFSVDHEDRNGLHNRIENLRLANGAQQQANQSLYANSKTGYKGVCFVTKEQVYQAGTRRGGKSLHLGWYPTAEEAAFAYNHTSIRLNGEFAWLNPIPPGAVSDARKAEIIARLEARYYPRFKI